MANKMGKFISVLIPTNRPADINARCINLLLTKAKNPQSIEFLFRIDYEDEFGQEWCNELVKNVPSEYSNNIKVIQGPRYI